MNKVIIIPARLSSTRLPRKVLLELKGKTVIERVFDQCKKVEGVEVFIAVDCKELKDVCESFTKNVFLTDSSHQSGTDRITEVIEKLDCKYVVNVQGDEPFVDPSLITLLFKNLENEEIEMTSVMERISKVSDYENPNVVKVVIDDFSNALYFSRSPIPFVRDNIQEMIDDDKCFVASCNFYKHVGIYGYKRDFLLKYAKSSQSRLEKLEKLEQLRALEMGGKIKMELSKSTSTIGIDTKEDYNKALKYIEENE